MSDDTNYELGPTLTWTPDLFGANKRRSIEQQKAFAEYETQQLNTTYVSLTGNVVVLAVNLAADRAQINAVSSMIATDEANFSGEHLIWINGNYSQMGE